MQSNAGEGSRGDVDPLDAFESELNEQAEAIEGDVETEKERSEKQQAEDEAARMGAAMAVGFVEMGLKMWKPYIVLPDDQKAALIEKGAPVVKKYDAALPPWLAPYKEELDLLAVVAVAGVSIVMQVKAYEAQKEQESGQGEGGGGNQQQKGAVNEIQSQESEFFTS